MVLIPTGTITVGSIVVMAAEVRHLRTDILGQLQFDFLYGFQSRMDKVVQTCWDGYKR